MHDCRILEQIIQVDVEAIEHGEDGQKGAQNHQHILIKHSSLVNPRASHELNIDIAFVNVLHVSCKRSATSATCRHLVV